MSETKIPTVREHTIRILQSCGFRAADHTVLESLDEGTRQRDRALLLEGIRLGVRSCRNVAHSVVVGGDVLTPLYDLNPADILAAHEKERERG